MPKIRVIGPITRLDVWIKLQETDWPNSRTELVKVLRQVADDLEQEELWADDNGKPYDPPMFGFEYKTKKYKAQIIGSVTHDKEYVK